MFRDYRHLLLVAPGEGAAATIDCSPPTLSADEVEGLLRAWSQERKERIETGLYLDQIRDLLLHILSEGRVTPTSRKKARRLFVAIDESTKPRAANAD